MPGGAPLALDLSRRGRRVPRDREKGEARGRELVSGVHGVRGRLGRALAPGRDRPRERALLAARAPRAVAARGVGRAGAQAARALVVGARRAGAPGDRPARGARPPRPEERARSGPRIRSRAGRRAPPHAPPPRAALREHAREAPRERSVRGLARGHAFRERARARRFSPAGGALGESVSRPRVVIVGAGFGGLYAAKALKRAPVDVVVLDRRNHHTFQPLLYQVATAALNPSDIAVPIRSILSRQWNVQVKLAEALSIDASARRVELSDGEEPYDFLIVATGATHSYFGRDDWAKNAPGLKTIEDALEIRRRVLL
ncbi:FAD-dependent oxidoreductase, partial [bacterium]|nr:FAD-dependent oxidoreductase [bacterium]